MMLSLITFLTLTSLPSLTFADQAVINAANSALQSQLSSLSSLFSAKPTPTTAGKPTFCCGDDCPPGACNLNHVIPTDLGYAFPAPTSGVSTPSSSLELPCCHANCPDGACRTTPVKASQRPMLTHPPRLGPSSQNIIVGCCKTCHNCDQIVTSIPEESLSAAATGTVDAAEAGITASPSLDDAAVPLQQKDGLNKQFPHGPGGELLTEICAGCGTCTPCELARIATWVEFYPHPTESSAEAVLTETPAASAASSSVRSAASKAKGSEGDEPEPTIYVADEIVDSINGKNQDFLPIILQNGGSDSRIAAMVGAGKKELRTLLAAVDFKLSENYISRRLLKHLGRLSDVVAYPEGAEESTAVVSMDLDKVQINATIVLDIVAGAQDHETRRRFSGVRFNVYGWEDDEVVNADVEEVILGGKLLREMNAITVYPGVKDAVQEGVKILEKTHFGLLQKNKDDQGGKNAGGKGHDEL